MPIPASSHPQSTFIISSDKDCVIALIRLLMDRSGLSQAEIGRRTGTKQQTISFYRKGRVKKPSIQWLARLASVCGARLYLELPPKPLESDWKIWSRKYEAKQLARQAALGLPESAAAAAAAPK